LGSQSEKGPRGKMNPDGSLEQAQTTAGQFVLLSLGGNSAEDYTSDFG